MLVVSRVRGKSLQWIALLAAVLLGGATTLAAQPYTLNLVAQTGQTIGGQTIFDIGIGCPPRINDAGTVVFGARSPDAHHWAIFTPTSVIAKTGDVAGARTLDSMSCPVLNNLGTTAFVTSFAAVNGQGLFTFQPGSGLTEIVDTVPVPYNPFVDVAGFLGNIAQNDNGTIVFIMTPPCSPGGRPCQPGVPADQITLSSITSGPPTALIAVGQVVGGQTVLQLDPPLSLNNNGTVVLSAQLSGGPAIITPTSIIAQGGQTIAGTTLTSVVNESTQSINTGGTIVFGGVYGSVGLNQFGIFTPGSFLIQTGQTIGGATISGPGLAIINDRGTVAFEAACSICIQSGIFTTTDLVIAEGQTVGGKTICFNCIAGFSFNNLNQFVIQTAFSDGTQGIIVATPVTTVNLSAAIVNKGPVSAGVRFYDLQITNHGPGNAAGISINQLPLSTLSGTGTVTNMTSLPINVGDLAAGASTTVHLTLGVPATVTRLRIGENGTFQNSANQTANFSLLQAVFP